MNAASEDMHHTGFTEMLVGVIDLKSLCSYGHGDLFKCCSEDVLPYVFICYCDFTNSGATWVRRFHFVTTTESESQRNRPPYFNTELYSSLFLDALMRLRSGKRLCVCSQSGWSICMG